MKNILNKLRGMFGGVQPSNRPVPTDKLSHWPQQKPTATAEASVAEEGAEEEEPEVTTPGDLMPYPRRVLCDGTDPEQCKLDMDAGLMFLSRYKQDWLTARDAFEGVLGLGATGSGKTSACGRLIKHAYLRAGWSGLVLCAKDDEAASWVETARECGRSKDLIIFNKESEFNFLDYELAYQTARGAIHIPDLVSSLMVLVEVQQRKNGNGKGDEYFANAAKQLLGYAMTILVIGVKKIDMMDIRMLILGAAKKVEDVSSPAWQAKSACWKFLSLADKNCPDERRVDLELATKFFLMEWPELNDRTRSSIESTLSTTLSDMYQSPVRKMFTGGTTISPDSIIKDGKIIVIDLSYKGYGTLGQYANVLWKLAVQRACERNLSRKYPTFIFVDECQYFTTQYDQLFQTTARSSRCATVFLTQSIPNLNAELGGDAAGKARVESLLGNLQTRFFHLNSESETNKWASETIGKDLIRMYSGNSSKSMSTQMMSPLKGMSGSLNTSEGYSEQFNYTLQPVEFSKLLPGGPKNNLVVTGIVHRVGRTWSTGERHLKCCFPQKDRSSPTMTPWLACARDSSQLRKMISKGFN